MRYRFHIVLFFSLFATVSASAARPALEFEELTMIFEMNETDGDAEVVITAQGFEGIKRLIVRAPNGKRVILVHSNDGGKRVDPIGLAEVLVETGEPNVAGVKAAYPEGTYQFFARTVSGARLYGEVVLSHDLLPAPDFSPKEAEDLDPVSVAFTWPAVDGAAAYVVEIENDDLGVNLTATLLGSTTRFTVPADFLLPGIEYEIGVATVTEDGNVAVAESTFTTSH